MIPSQCLVQGEDDSRVSSVTEDGSSAAPHRPGDATGVLARVKGWLAEARRLHHP
jgi:hypothetical protein